MPMEKDGRYVNLQGTKHRSTCLIFGYCRLESIRWNIYIPPDIMKLCFIWYYIHNTDHINVFCRFRPQMPWETNQNAYIVVDVLDDNKSVTITHPDKCKHPKPIQFPFDYVFDWNCTQQNVFDITTKNSIYSMFEGYNATIISYGFSQSGKTFSMTGTQNNKGCIPRAIHLIYTILQSKMNNSNSKYMQYSLHINYFQYYAEMLKDLLDKNSTGEFKVRADKFKGVCIENMTSKECNDKQELIKWIQYGDKNMDMDNTGKHMHRYNPNSLILIIHLCQTNLRNRNKTISNLMFVDLCS
eukprot:368865_1